MELKKKRFYISLVIIIAISMLDVHYVGNHLNFLIPEKFHQPIHLFVLLLVMYIGYYNWKFYDEAWLKNVWVIAYALVIGMLFVTGVLSLLKVPLSQDYIIYVAKIRNWFIWPIVFIVFHFFPNVVERTDDQKKS